MQAHYLSNRSHNSFIQTCAERVGDKILEERQKSIYFSIIVDATPDRSHKEQITFILRYVHWDDTKSMWDIHGRFLCFENCSAKTGADISNLILRTLEKYKIPIADCRGQGYDNASNMAGKYKGVKVLILEKHPLALFGPCATHSLNLCGVHAAQSCNEVIILSIQFKPWSMGDTPVSY